MTQVAAAEGLRAFPGWRLEKVEATENVYEDAESFWLISPDGGEPIRIDSRLANRLRAGTVDPSDLRQRARDQSGEIQFESRQLIIRSTKPAANASSSSSSGEVEEPSSPGPLVIGGARLSEKKSPVAKPEKAGNARPKAVAGRPVDSAPTAKSAPSKPVEKSPISSPKEGKVGSGLEPLSALAGAGKPEASSSEPKVEVLAAGKTAAEDSKEFVLTPFYRFMQIQGAMMTVGGSPVFVKEIPLYLRQKGIDFPYRFGGGRKKSEIPYVDRFSVARFVGGHQKRLYDIYGEEAADLFAKGPGGKTVYRFDLAKARLDAYLKAGYRLQDITLTLDNVPWDFAQGGGREDKFGNTAPPQDISGWIYHIGKLGEFLAKTYGAAANQLSFKMGIEYNTEKSWTGSADQLRRMYMGAHQAIGAHLPNARFSTGEFSSSFDKTTNGVPYRVLLRSIVEDPGFVQKKTLARIPRSLHYLPDDATKTTESRVVSMVSDYQEFYASLSPRGLKRESAPAEVHQFGILGEKLRDVTGLKDVTSRDVTVSGVRQAAWGFQVMFRLRRRMEVPTIAHWNCFDSFNLGGGEEAHLFTGRAWLYQFLDNMLGSRVTYLKFGQDVDAQKSEHLAVAFRKGDRLYVVVSTFAPDPTESDESRETKVAIPQKLLGNKKAGPIRALSFHDRNAVHRKIRDDLEAAGNLQPLFKRNSYLIGRVGEMAVDLAKARAMVRENMPAYESAARWLLTLRPSEARLEKKGEGYRLPVVLPEGTAMQVFEIRLH